MRFCHSPSPWLCRVGKSPMSNGVPANPATWAACPSERNRSAIPLLVEDLDGARMQTACARAGEALAGAPLDDGNVDPRHRQLARQHQPRRTSSGDHHRMLGHSLTPAGIMPPAASASLGHRGDRVELRGDQLGRATGQVREVRRRPGHHRAHRLPSPLATCVVGEEG